MSGLSRFVDLETIKELEGRVWQVPSSSDPAKVYRVVEEFPDHFSCECPDYLYRHSGSDSPDCKHITAIRVKLIAEKRSKRKVADYKTSELIQGSKPMHRNGTTLPFEGEFSL